MEAKWMLNQDIVRVRTQNEEKVDEKMRENE